MRFDTGEAGKVWTLGFRGYLRWNFAPAHSEPGASPCCGGQVTVRAELVVMPAAVNGLL